MPRGNIHSRLDRLEERAPKPEPERPLIRPEFKEFLDGCAARKRDGCLTEEDGEFARQLKAEVKKREARGEIGRRGGGR